MSDKVETAVAPVAAEAEQAQVLNGVTLRTIHPVAANKLTALSAQIKEITGGGTLTSESTEEEKNKAYDDVQDIWNVFAETLRTAPFSFALNRDQYDFLVDVLTKQLNYGVDEVFVAMKLRDEFLSLQFPGSGPRKQLTEYYLTSETMVMMYHLIAKHKVKGLGTSAEHFVAVLRGIGTVSTEFNAFDNESKRLSNAISDFFATITPLDEVYTEGAEAISEEAPKNLGDKAEA